VKINRGKFDGVPWSSVYDIRLDGERERDHGFESRRIPRLFPLVKKHEIVKKKILSLDSGLCEWSPEWT